MRRLEALAGSNGKDRVLAVSKPALENVFVSLVRIDREKQHNLFKPLEEAGREESDVLLEAYDAALKLSHAYQDDRIATAEEYEGSLDESSYSPIVRRFLADGDPDGPTI